MVSLGQLTLDLKLNDAGYKKGLDEAFKQASKLDREFETTLTANTKGFVDAFAQAAKIRDRLDRVITAEFRVNTNQIQGALKIAEEARKEFKAQQKTTFTADVDPFRKAVAEIKRSKADISTPVKTKIGVDISGLFSALNSATKSVRNLAKPVTVPIDAKVTGFDRSITRINKSLVGLKKPTTTSVRLDVGDFFRVFKNVQAAKTKLSDRVVVDFTSRGEERILAVLKDAQSAKRNLSGNSVVQLKAKADGFFRVFKNAQAAKKTFTKPVSAILNGDTGGFTRALNEVERLRKTVAKTLTVKIIADAGQFFRTAKSVEARKKNLTGSVTSTVKLEAGQYFRGVNAVERSRKSIVKNTTVTLRANATQFFKAKKRIDTAKADFRKPATAEIKANATQFFRASKAIKAEKQDLRTPISARLNLDTGSFSNDIRSAKSEFNGFAKSLNSGGLGKGLFTGIFQGIGQELTEIITNALRTAFTLPIKGGVQIIKDFANLEQALVTFQSRAAASVKPASDLAAVTADVAAAAKQIGIETSKTPEQVAAISTRMVELGGNARTAAVDVGSVVTALEATGFTDIDKTAKTFQVAFNTFGTSAEDFADKLAFVSNTTAITSATDIQQAFGKAAGVFETAGQSANTLFSIFGAFKQANGPERAATATRNSLLKLLAPVDQAKSKLDDLGISIFDPDTGAERDLIGVLDELDQKLKGLSPEDSFNFLRTVFDNQTAGDIAFLLSQLDKVKDTFNGLEEDSEGFAKEAQDLLNQGIAQGLIRLQGSLTTFSTEFGKAFGDGPNQLIRGITASINEVLLATNNGLFDPLTASSERLVAAISGGSFTVQSFGQGLIGLVNVVQNTLVRLFDGLSGFFESNPDFLNNFIENFTQGFEELVSVVASVGGEIATQLGPSLGVAINIFEGVIDQSDNLIEILQVLGAVINPLVGALKLLTDNAGFVEFALEAIIALKIASFISAAVGPTLAFASSLGATAVAASALILPLTLLAAAVAAIGFIRAANEARQLNDAILELNETTNQQGDSALVAANKLNQEIDRQTEAKKRGLAIDERALEARIKAAEVQRDANAEQRRAIQQQIDDLGPVNDSRTFGINIRADQRSALDNQLKELEAADKALNGRINAARGLVTTTNAELVEQEKASAEAIQQELQAAVDEYDQLESKKIEIAKERLAELEQITKDTYARIDNELNQTLNNILRQQLSGDLSDNDAAQQQVDAQKKASRERVAAIEAEQRALREAGNQQIINGTEVAKQLAELEKEKQSAIRSALTEELRFQQDLERQKEAETKKRVEAQKKAEAEAKKAAEEATKERIKNELEQLSDYSDAVDRVFEDQVSAFEKALDDQEKAAKKSLDNQEKLAEKEFEFRQKQLDKLQKAEDEALTKSQKKEAETLANKLSAAERFVDRQIQLQDAETKEERKALRDQFKEEDKTFKERNELRRKALQNLDSIANRDTQARGDGDPFAIATEELSDEQAAEQKALEDRQLLQQEKLAALREEQEERFEAKRELLEEQFAVKRNSLEDTIAEKRKVLEDELGIRRKEIEGEIEISRSEFAENQRALDLAAANQIKAVLEGVSIPGLNLTPRRHGGRVGPSGDFLVGEAPNVGPELGIFGNKQVLFGRPTVLPAPPPGRIYSPEQTKRMMAGSNTSTSQTIVTTNNSAELRNEIRQLRQQVGQVKEVLPLLSALSSTLASDKGKLAKDQAFENAKHRLRRV